MKKVVTFLVLAMCMVSVTIMAAKKKGPSAIRRQERRQKQQEEERRQEEYREAFSVDSIMPLFAQERLERQRENERIGAELMTMITFGVIPVEIGVTLGLAAGSFIGYPREGAVLGGTLGLVCGVCCFSVLPKGQGLGTGNALASYKRFSRNEF